ncbi:unnamed protein product [Amoebophrya sp. A25]|nr:unnamed protein product [Amoebophrya sp. A25]|eukprot:GSA25T00014367001.1
MSEIRKLIGYCPQTNSLRGDLTVWDTAVLFAHLRFRDLQQWACDQNDTFTRTDPVAFFRSSSISPSSTTCRTWRMKNAIEHEVEKKLQELDLADVRERRFKTLSGGTQRRVMLLLALLFEPPLVLLDEPTAGVDPLGRQVVWRVLRAISHNRSSSTNANSYDPQNRQSSQFVLTSHAMEEVEALCDKVALQHAGELRAIGTVSEMRSQYKLGYEIRVKFRDDYKCEDQDVEDHSKTPCTSTWTKLEQRVLREHDIFFASTFFQGFDDGSAKQSALHKKLVRTKSLSPKTSYGGKNPDSDPEEGLYREAKPLLSEKKNLRNAESREQDSKYSATTSSTDSSSSSSSTIEDSSEREQSAGRNNANNDSSSATEPDDVGEDLHRSAILFPFAIFSWVLAPAFDDLGVSKHGREVDTYSKKTNYRSTADQEVARRLSLKRRNSAAKTRVQSSEDDCLEDEIVRVALKDDRKISFKNKRIVDDLCQSSSWLRAFTLCCRRRRAEKSKSSAGGSEPELFSSPRLLPLHTNAYVDRHSPGIGDANSVGCGVASLRQCLAMPDGKKSLENFLEEAGLLSEFCAELAQRVNHQRRCELVLAFVRNALQLQDGSGGSYTVVPLSNAGNNFSFTVSRKDGFRLCDVRRMMEALAELKNVDSRGPQFLVDEVSFCKIGLDVVFQKLEQH